MGPTAPVVELGTTSAVFPVELLDRGREPAEAEGMDPFEVVPRCATVVSLVCGAIWVRGRKNEGRPLRALIMMGLEAVRQKGCGGRR